MIQDYYIDVTFDHNDMTNLIRNGIYQTHLITYNSLLYITFEKQCETLNDDGTVDT